MQEKNVLDCLEFFLQILTQLEGVIKRDYLSADYETAEELMGLCALSINAACESTFPGSVPQLPWIPQTTGAVALRLLELDASISYDPQQKTEAELKNKVDSLPVELSSPLVQVILLLITLGFTIYPCLSVLHDTVVDLFGEIQFVNLHVV